MNIIMLYYAGKIAVQTIFKQLTFLGFFLWSWSNFKKSLDFWLDATVLFAHQTNLSIFEYLRSDSLGEVYLYS